MLQSKLFTKTQKTFPKDEEAINAKLLIKGGYIRKLSAGVYTYLPLAWRVLGKINRIIREEMNAIGGQELLMNTLVAKEYWEKTNRWETPVAFKTAKQQIANSQLPEFALGWTHEEVITHIATNFINSYKDLPFSAYQIQTKFRAEERAKNGLLRGREFMMKDLYSFHTSKEDLDRFYGEVIGAYKKILKRVQLPAKVTEAAGGAFTKEYTHEFQALLPAGEDIVMHCEKCDFAQNRELNQVQEGGKCPKCGNAIKKSNGIEVANVFRLGTRYSDAFNLKFTDKDGSQKPVIMGSYGIGPTRLLATLVEMYNDERGIIWPESVSPFKVHLVGLGNDPKVKKNAEKIYAALEKKGVEVLYDDRDAGAGEKLGDADLLGITWRAIVSEKTGAKIELKKRNSQKAELVILPQFLKKIK